MTAGLQLLAAFFGFVMGAVMLAGYFVLRRNTADGEPQDRRQGGLRAPVARALEHLGERVRIGRSDTTRKLLFTAGYREPSAPTIFYGTRIVTALGLAGIVGWATFLWGGVPSAAWIPALCLGGVGYLLPERVLQWQSRARALRIRSGIPVALDLLVLSVEAGQALDLAMLDAARALTRAFPELSAEWIFCHLEMRAGKSRAEALSDLAERVREPELAKLTHLLADSDRFGTSMGPALRSHARYLRLRLRQRVQESARKLTVKLVFPVFFLIFPSIFLVTLGPAYLQLQEHFTNFLGQ